MNTPPTYLDFVEQLWGDKLTLSNGPAVMARDLSMLQEFRERYLEGYWNFRNWMDSSQSFYPSGDGPRQYGPIPSLPHESCPLLLRHQYPYEARFVPSYRPIRHAHGFTDSAVRALKRRLLYVHRVVLTDPLFDISATFLSHSDDGTWGKNALIEHFDFLSTIRPLVQNGIVGFVPTFEVVPWGRKFNLVHSDDKFADWLQQKHLSPDDHDAFVNYFPDLLELLWLASRHGAVLDLSDSQWRALFSHVWEYAQTSRFPLGSGACPPQVLDGDTWVVDKIASLHLPGVDNLTLDDLVMARQCEGDFELWRTRLRSLVARLESNPEDTAQHDHLRTDLAEIAYQLLRDSPLRVSKVVRNSMLPLCVGLAFSMISPQVLGIATGVLGTVLTAVIDYAKGSRERGRTRAVAKHYLVFGQSDEVNDRGHR